MDHRDVGRYWDANARTWLAMEELGHNIARDHVNTPAFLEMLPEVQGLSGLDIGCGPADTTRLVAERGARIVGIDIAQRFVEHAARREREDPRGLRFVRSSAVALPFGDDAFDFVIATMSLMDIPDLEGVVSEVRRVLRPGGFLQLSILHPCMSLSRDDDWVRDDAGHKIGVRLAGYWDRPREWVEEWTFSAAPPETRRLYPLLRTPRFEHTLAEWLNLLAGAGLVLEQVTEPRATPEQASRIPALADTRIVPWFILMRYRRPSGG